MKKFVREPFVEAPALLIELLFAHLDLVTHFVGLKAAFLLGNDFIYLK